MTDWKPFIASLTGRVAFKTAKANLQVRAAFTFGCREGPLAKKRGVGAVPTVPRGLLCAVTSPTPILQMMWETASLGNRWLAPAFHVRRPNVYLW